MNFRDDVSRIVNSLTYAGFGSYNATNQDFYEFDNGDYGGIDCLAEVLEDGLNKEVCSFTGSTKAVFDICERDYVVKIPFNGEEVKRRHDEEEEDYGGGYDSEYKFEKFKYANHNFGEGNSWDYCEQEENIYNKATALGIGDMFAGTVKIANIHNYPIYASEKAESYSKIGNGSSSSNETVRHIFSNINWHGIEDSELYLMGEQLMGECDEKENFSTPDRMNLEFLGYMIEYFGKEKVRTLCEFLYRNRLNDFHSSNVGFIEDKPVLIDYSGFFEYL